MTGIPASLDDFSSVEVSCLLSSIACLNPVNSSSVIEAGGTILIRIESVPKRLLSLVAEATIWYSPGLSNLWRNVLPEIPATWFNTNPVEFTSLTVHVKVDGSIEPFCGSNAVADPPIYL